MAVNFFATFAVPVIVGFVVITRFFVHWAYRATSASPITKVALPSAEYVWPDPVALVFQLVKL